MNTARVRGPAAERRASRSSRQLRSGLHEGHQPGDRAGQAHPIGHPGVGRIGENDFVARVGGGEERVEDAFGAAGGDHDLARLVALAGAPVSRSATAALRWSVPTKGR